MAVDFSFILRNDAVFDILLPFVLVFTIIFAVLQTTKILGGRKNIDAIFSIVFSFFLIRNQAVVATINRFLPNVSLAIIVILMILLIIGVFLGERHEWAHGFKGLAAILSIIIVIWIFSSSYWNSSFGIPNIFDSLDPQTKGILIFLAILIIIIYFVTREESERRSAGESFDKFGELIFKKK